MHKICILGNSHVACLKHGWTKIAENHPDFQISFFAEAGNDGLGTVCLDGRQLTAKSDHARNAFTVTHGKDRLDIDEYDGFLIFGARAQTFWPTDTFYSTACLDAAFDDLTTGTPANRVLTCLAEVTDAPIYVGHSPLLAAREIRDRTVSDAYLAGLELLNDRYYSKHGARMLGQPLSTIVNGSSTAPELSWGVPKLSAVNGVDDARQAATDNSHMDAVFGALWLEAFFEILAKKSR